MNDIDIFTLTLYSESYYKDEQGAEQFFFIEKEGREKIMKNEYWWLFVAKAFIPSEELF